MAKQKDHKVGVYARLSKEDQRAGESVSIENQVLMLTAHAKSQGWELVEVYRDDGFSGTNQNRPGLQRMMADIKDGRINTVLIKDLSRLGRNYIEVGGLQEIFLPEHDCELISLSEKMDDMTVFRNYFNEQYSKDTSKKVRAVKRMCAQGGKFIGAYAPYGYRRDEKNKHLLVPDPTAAATVRNIFELRSQGMGYKAIAQQLNDSGIAAPRDYWYQQKGETNPHRISHCWCNVTVKGILTNEVYIGNLVQLRYGSKSYKNHKLVNRPEEEWVRADGTHEPLVSRELWDRAQALVQKRHSPHKRRDGGVNLFTGLLYCADCGFSMRGQTQRKVRKNGNLYERVSYACGSYSRSGKGACTAHIIGEDILHELVAGQIREHARMVEYDEARMVEEILRLQNSESEASRAAYLSELQAQQSRLTMLDRLLEKLYEDRLTGTIPEAVFRSLMEKYEEERVERRQSAANLENRIRGIRHNASKADKWAKLIRQYTTLEKLDKETLLLLVDRIEIGHAITVNGQHARDIRIIYNYVGDIGGLCLTAYGRAV